MTADDVKRILVVGAGQMGSQIAMQAALHGYAVTLNDVSGAIIEKGVAPFWEIDKAVELGLNFPMGPFRLGDLSGLDIGYNARLETYERTKDPNDLPPTELKKRVERGDLGRKTGRGFYDYSKNPPEPIRD